MSRLWAGYYRCLENEKVEREEWETRQRAEADRQRRADEVVDRQEEAERRKRAEGFEAAIRTTNVRTVKFTDESFPASDGLYWSDYPYESSSSVAKQA